MKKIVNLLLIVCMVFSVGCAGKQDVNDKSEKVDAIETPTAQSHLMEIRKVIEDEKRYISILEEFEGELRGEILEYVGPNRFSIVDMDGDGEEEVVVEDKCSDIVVFHYEAGDVQYFKFPFRGLKCLKEDGTYESSDSAVETQIKKLKFKDGKYVETCLCVQDVYGEIYTIDGREVSLQAVYKFINTHRKKQDVEWYEVNEKNLARLGDGHETEGNYSAGEKVEVETTQMPKKKAKKMKYTYNPYFPDAKFFTFEYKMSGWFLEWGDEPLETYKVKIVFNQIKEFSDGKLYEVMITQPKKRRIPPERIDLDYFFVQRNRIYSVHDSLHREVSASEFEKLKKYGTLPRNSTVICQENGIEDRLKEGKIGWHQLLEVDGNRRWYRSWEQLQHRSGWWEGFVFQKGLGLVGYKSGSSAGVDYMILSMRGLKIY